MPPIGALHQRRIFKLLPPSQLVELQFEVQSPLLLSSQLDKLHPFSIERVRLVGKGHLPTFEDYLSLYFAVLVYLHRLGESKVSLINLIACRSLVRLQIA